MILNSAKSNSFEKPITIQAALSNKSGTAILDFSDGVGFGSIVRDFGSNDTVEVETTTIDSIVQNMGLEKVNFIKLDIEGAELLALEGAANTMRKLKPTLCLECENDRIDEITKYLENFNYYASVFDLNGDLVKLKLCGAEHILPNNTNQVFYIPGNQVQ